LWTFKDAASDFSIRSVLNSMIFDAAMFVCVCLSSSSLLASQLLVSLVFGKYGQFLGCSTSWTQCLFYNIVEIIVY
jgi:hypothetical protein